jgi:hypothetical protein
LQGKEEKIYWRNAFYIREGFSLFMNIHQHLWDNVRGGTDVNKGQVAEEEIHGGCGGGSQCM